LLLDSESKESSSEIVGIELLIGHADVKKSDEAMDESEGAESSEE
jgi:hypothetical protein